MSSPLARKFIKQLTLPVKKRSFIGDLEVVRKIASAKHFDVSAISSAEGLLQAVTKNIIAGQDRQ